MAPIRIISHIFLFVSCALPVSAQSDRALGANGSRTTVLTYTATVVASKPAEGRVDVLVSAVLLPNATDLHLSTPVPAALLMGTSGRRYPRIRLNGFGTIRDLKAGTCLSIAVRGLPSDPPALDRLVSVSVVPSETVDSTEPMPLASSDTKGDRGPSTPAKGFVPMIFPVLGNTVWHDTFGAPRDNGRRQHIGQDIAAPKMRPIVAPFDGIFSPTSYLRGDNGWTAVF